MNEEDDGQGSLTMRRRERESQQLRWRRLD